MRNRPGFRPLWTILLVIAASACGGASGSASVADGGATPDAGPASVEIGLPAGSDGLDFAPLAPQGELRLESFGQGGIHVLLAIRCVGFGNRAFVRIGLTNLLTGAEVVAPAPARPQLLLCRSADVCDLVPVLAMAGGLVAPGEERDGLHILVTAEVHNEAGAAASGSQEAALSTADL